MFRCYLASLCAKVFSDRTPRSRSAHDQQSLLNRLTNKRSDLNEILCFSLVATFSPTEGENVVRLSRDDVLAHPVDFLVTEKALDIVELSVVVPDVADGNVRQCHHWRWHAPRGSNYRIENVVTRRLNRFG